MGRFGALQLNVSTYPLEFLLACLTPAVLVDAYLSSKNSGDRWLRPLRLLGLCSYSVYLIHQPLIPAFTSILSASAIRHPALQVA